MVVQAVWNRGIIHRSSALPYSFGVVDDGFDGNRILVPLKIWMDAFLQLSHLMPVFFFCFFFRKNEIYLIVRIGCK